MRLQIDLRHVPEIARLNGVMWIEPWAEPKLTNDVAREIMGVEKKGVWNTHGLYGDGQIIAIADTGLDVGITNTISADFTGRVVRSYCLGRPGTPGNTGPDPDAMLLGWSVERSQRPWNPRGWLSSGEWPQFGSDPAFHHYAGSYAGVAPEAGSLSNP